VVADIVSLTSIDFNGHDAYFSMVRLLCGVWNLDRDDL